MAGKVPARRHGGPVVRTSTRWRHVVRCTVRRVLVAVLCTLALYVVVVAPPAMARSGDVTDLAAPPAAIRFAASSAGGSSDGREVLRQEATGTTVGGLDGDWSVSSGQARVTFKVMQGTITSLMIDLDYGTSTQCPRLGAIKIKQSGQPGPVTIAERGFKATVPAEYLAEGIPVKVNQFAIRAAFESDTSVRGELDFTPSPGPGGGLPCVVARNQIAWAATRSIAPPVTGRLAVTASTLDEATATVASTSVPTPTASPTPSPSSPPAPTMSVSPEPVPTVMVFPTSTPSEAEWLLAPGWLLVTVLVGALVVASSFVVDVVTGMVDPRQRPDSRAVV